MSFGNITETDILGKIFNNTALPWDAITDLFLSLHTADPGEAGSQLTSEAVHGGYVRIPVARTGAGWVVAGNQVSNDDLVQFAVCSSGSDLITHAAIGTSLAGAGQVLVKGALTASRTISTGIQPQFSPGQLVFTLD